MHAEFADYRAGNFSERQFVERRFDFGREGRAVGIADVSSLFPGNRVAGKLERQCREILAVGEPPAGRTRLLKRFFLGNAEGFEQDMGSAFFRRSLVLTAFLLVAGQQFLGSNRYFLGDNILIEHYIAHDHGFGLAKILLVPFVVFAYALVADCGAESPRADRNGNVADIARLLLQLDELFEFAGRQEIGAGIGIGDLGQHHAPAQILAEHRYRHALAGHGAHGKVAVEHAVDLELGGIENELVDPRAGNRQRGSFRGLPQHDLVDQLIERDVFNQTGVERSGVGSHGSQQILHAHLQLQIIDFFAVHFRDGWRGDESADNRFHSPERENGNDQADDHLGDHTLGIVSDVLEHFLIADSRGLASRPN